MVTRYVFRLYVFGLLLLAGFGALLWRLWVVQIVDFKKYASALPETGTVRQYVPGLRGEIRDRNGVSLATNRMSYEIKLDLKEIERIYRSHDENGVARHKTIPKVVYRARDEYGIDRDHEEADIFKMYEEEVFPQLDRLHLATKINSDLMRKHYRTNRGVIPFTYAKEVSFDELAIVAEQSKFLDGVTYSKRPLRQYPYGALLCHVLGYVKQIGVMAIPPEERGRYQAYEPDDIGIAGIESTMDNVLRGRPGLRVFPKDEHGHIVHEEIMEKRVEPVKGSDVFLSIDVRLQYIATMALREAGVGRGAAVVLDPNDGDVLAMVSTPDYDPNKFIPFIEGDEWEAYIDDKTDPMGNRAIQSFPPGSIFKIPIAVAGCVAGLSGREFNCDGGYTVGDHTFHCWTKGAHGGLHLVDAIMLSCDCFFYQYGRATGIDTIDRVARWFNLGETTGIDLKGEDPGLVPSPKYLAMARGEKWTDSHTILSSIGQDMVLTSPLQMATVAATVANSGTCYKPRLILKVHDHGENIDTAFPDRPRYDLVKEGVKPQWIDIVRQGMFRVVNKDGGTAKVARSVGFDTAGKTGTADAWRRDPETHQPVHDKKTWFIAFAPFDKPKFAIAVVVEGGDHGGSTAAPIAARILKQAMAMETGGYQPALKGLAEAKGHFRLLGKTIYTDDPVAAALAAAQNDDDDTPADPPPPPRESDSPRRSNAPKPSIKPRANPEGSNVRTVAPPPPSGGVRGLFDKLFHRNNPQ